MINFTRSTLTLAALSLLANPIDAQAQRKRSSKTEESAATPKTDVDNIWRDKANLQHLFSLRAPLGDLASIRHLAANFNWYAVSDDLAEKPGMFTNYRLYIGITEEGRHEGIIYDDSVAGAVNPKVAVNLLNNISGLTIFAEEGEGVLIDLNPVESATIPNKKDPTKTDTVHFRTFQFPQRAYRMMGALPEENRMRFFYRKPDGETGYFGYHQRRGPDDPWAYQIGYAKELSQNAMKSAQQ
ncbi:MAG: hypothetical protein ABJP34_13500 [Erythrobacter sp.]